MAWAWLWAVLLVSPVVAASPPQVWRVLVLRCQYPVESPDEPTTSGTGGFDLRSTAEGLASYRFPFELPPHDRGYFESHLEALANYYRTVSQGRIEIRYAVYPVGPRDSYALPRSALHYGNGRSEAEIGARWVEMLADAVALAEADPAGPALDQFDSFLVLHAGVGGETGQLNDVRSVFLGAADLQRYHDGPLLAAGGRVTINSGWILPESPSLDGRAGLNGLLAKFFGHQLGLPGLSNFAEGLPALGGWSLMDVGANSVGFVRQDSLMPVIGFVPPFPEAWSRVQLGWSQALDVRRDTLITVRAADRPGSEPDVVRVPVDDRESFWLENRQQRGTLGAPAGVPIAGGAYDPDSLVWIDGGLVHTSTPNRVWTAVDEYDAFVPGSGLLVWHIDDEVISARRGAGTINNEPVHPGMALVEADGYRDLGYATFERYGQIEGSPDDAFFVGGRTALGADTYPDTRTYRGWDSGVRFDVLSPPGDLMQVRVTFPRAATGWPRPLVGGQGLQAADLDADGRADLLVQQPDGFAAYDAEARLLMQVPGGRLLAVGSGVGPPAVYVARGDSVGAWRYGASLPQWWAPVGFAPLCGLVARNTAFSRDPVLVAGGARVVCLDAATGRELARAEAPATNLQAADLDGDQVTDLTWTGSEGAWQWSASAPLPLTVPAALDGPVAGDLDGDGRLDWLAAAPDGRVLTRAGGADGWRAAFGDSVLGGLALGDLDADGRLEVVARSRTRIMALRADGTWQAGFPVQVPPRAGGAGPAAGGPVLVDLDGDGGQEVLVGTAAGVFGVDGRGRLLTGFPLLTQAPVNGSPVVIALTDTTALELAALSAEALYVWRPQGINANWQAKRSDWPQPRGSATMVATYTGKAAVPSVDPKDPLLPADRAYCWPNPVNGNELAHLRFFLNRPAHVRLEVFDPLGRRVGRVEAPAGLAAPAENELAISVSGWASGLYLGRLVARGDDGASATVVVRLAVSR